MSDKFGIESHKIMYHPERTAQWLEAGDGWDKLKKVYPIYVEISPAGSCNHRCIFCALDYVGYQPVFLDTQNLKKTFTAMAEGGVKSIMMAGEGEPLLHPDIVDLTVHAKKIGLDVAFTTNGVLITDKFLSEALPAVTWMKISLDAGTAETYSKIHRTQPEDFEKVLVNLKKAVQLKRQNKLNCTIGAQMVLLPENAHEVILLAKKLKEIGLDYFVVKPYSQHHKSLHRNYENIKYEQYAGLDAELKNISDDKFSVIFRGHTMKKWDVDDKPYSVCRATPFFWAYLMSNGDLYSCSAFLGDQRFVVGNIKEKSFSEIWEGEKRRQNWELLRKDFDINNCRQNCRMDEVNRFLYSLKDNLPEHVNFI